METKLTTADISNYLKLGDSVIDILSKKKFDKEFNENEKKIFREVIEIGIQNTIATLCDAEVEEKNIICVVNEHWGIGFNDIKDRIAFYKKNHGTDKALKIKMSQMTDDMSENDYHCLSVGICLFFKRDKNKI